MALFHTQKVLLHSTQSIIHKQQEVTSHISAVNTAANVPQQPTSLKARETNLILSDVKNAEIGKQPAQYQP